MAADGAFGDLRKLADWFAAAPTTSWARIERLTRRLGGIAVPLLGRELRSDDPRRREAARDALASLAQGDTPPAERALAELAEHRERTPIASASA